MKEQKYSQNQTTKIIIMIMFIAFYYLSYRYPFQINSATTSPTYVDTPIIFQLLKYVFFVFFIYYIFLTSLAMKLKAEMTKKKVLELFIYLLLFIVPILSFIAKKDFFFLENSVFFIAVIWVIVMSKGDFEIKKITKFINIFIIIAIIVEGIQILMFFTMGRLPALAYENSISVRFGSIWDDPNGFGFFLSFLVPFAYSAKKKMLSILLVTMLVLTQSLTGIAGLALCIPVAILLQFFKSKESKKLMTFFFVIVIYALFAFFFYEFVYKSSFFKNFMEIKQGSIDGHFEAFGHFDKVSIYSYLGLNPQGLFGESGYVNILLNYGAFYLIIYIISIILTISRLTFLSIKNEGMPGNELFNGALFFTIIYAVGMINLPMDTVFPINLIYILCIIFSLYKKKENLIEQVAASLKGKYREI